LPRLLRELTAALHPGISRLLRMAKPLVTAINGPAAGAGLSLAILGDIAIASDRAHFTVGYPGVGMAPDVGASFLLPRLVGLRRAQEIILLNERLSAARALEIGLVTRVVPDEKLAETAEEILQKLAAGPTRALGRARLLLLESFSTPLETQLEQEARSIAQCGAEPDGREGINAFTAKRPPVFTGQS
jgi:2-(1,2-epoxy-1,2-dihydrophenyl)acetyl-CoA isomerase